MVKADKIFYNGEIVTMDFGLNTVNALAVSGDRIIATGNDADMDVCKGPRTQMIDLGGKTVFPGFIDAHGHFLFNAFFRTRAVDLNSPPVGNVTCMDDILNALKEKAENTPEGELVIGFGYDDTSLKEKRHPLRSDLDKVSTTHPIYVVHMSGHVFVANSNLIDKHGLTRSTPQPSGGAFRVDENGEPNGILEELTGAELVGIGAPEMSLDEVCEVVENGSDLYLAAGVTTAQEGAAFPIMLPAYQYAHSQGALKTRVQILPYYPFPTDSYPTHVSGTPVTDDRMISIGAFKIHNDGSIQAYTAYLTTPYFRPHPTQPKDDLYVGYPFMTDEELNAMVLERHKQGWQIAIHGNGDAAIETILNAFEAAQKEYPRDGARHIIIHCQMVREDQLDRMKRLGVIPSFFATHTYFWGDRHRDLFIGPHRAERIDPCRSAYIRGMPFTNHNDPHVTPINPILSIWSAANRITSSGQVLGENQKVPVIEAIKSVTTYAAYQAFEERDKGSLEVGKLADMVVLDANPLKIDPVEIKDVNVLATLVGAEVVYGQL